MRGRYNGATQIPRKRFVEDINLKKLGALGNATTPFRWGLGEREIPIIRDNRDLKPYLERLKYLCPESV
ncbi:MAG: hypothetical protein ACFFDT_31625 [Candidatus Hodarchaeota archaeon]